MPLVDILVSGARLAAELLLTEVFARVPPPIVEFLWILPQICLLAQILLSEPQSSLASSSGLPRHALVCRPSTSLTRMRHARSALHIVNTKRAY
jgi:hypothetical protein